MFHFVCLSANDVDQRARIGRRLVGPPGDVTVGPHQHQAALVGSEHARFRKLGAGQLHVALIRGLQDLRRRWWIGAETQQHKAAAVEVERGAAVVEPDVGRAGAGPGGLDVRMGLVRRRRCAVGPHDR